MCGKKTEEEGKGGGEEKIGNFYGMMEGQGGGDSGFHYLVEAWERG